MLNISSFVNILFFASNEARPNVDIYALAFITEKVVVLGLPKTCPPVDVTPTERPILGL
jgi:hypothetical protein